MKTVSLLLALFFMIVSTDAHADEFTISFASPPTPELLTLNLHFIFDQPTVIYHWRPLQSIYPILGSGLYIECHNLDSGAEVFLVPHQKIMPKVPVQRDTLKVSMYQGQLKLVPGRNYVYTKLEKGRYSLKLIYDTEELRKYPGGKEITLKRIESNEITFEIE